MSEPFEPLLHDEHFRAFGAIIQMFARHETLMIGVLSTLLKTDVAELHMITAELPYRGKREALLAMIRARPLPAAQIEKISWFLGELNKWNQLRNAIAHSAWKPGLRPKSIRPLSLSVRGGKLTIKGVEESERDYTDEELVNIADELIANHQNFRDYLFGVKLLPRTVEDG